MHILLILIIASYISVAIIIFARFHKNLKKNKNIYQSKLQRNIFLSVIIPYHNEEKIINKTLPSLVSQSYNNYELILINDNSTDKTPEILKTWQRKYPNKIKLINVKYNDKKKSLIEGVKNSRSDYLVFTDADCIAPRHWLEIIAKFFSHNYEFIAGISPYIPEKNFINKIIQFDTMVSATLYSAFNNYMAVGRNMAIHKKLFQKLSFNFNIKSGIDDLSIQQAEKTITLMLPESFVYSIPVNSLTQWIQQRKRHYKSFFFYKKKYILLLILLQLQEIIMWIIAFFFPITFVFIIIKFFLLKLCVKKLKWNVSTLELVLYFVLWFIIHLYSFILSTLSGKTLWRSEIK